MRQTERILKVQQLFAKQEFVSLEELCKLFDASKSSVRRDLIGLEEKGILKRVHGGAISLQTQDEVLDFSRLSGSSYAEKARIGKLASTLIEDGQTVILGGGSTVVEVARHLANKSIQIVTNSIPVAQIFWDSKRVEVTLTGGYLYPRLGVQLGPICERMLQSVSADMLIMGIHGISSAGISDSNSLNVGSIRAMIKAARKVVVAADHSKFGRDGMIQVAEWSEVHKVITDDGLAPEFQEMLKQKRVEILLAS
jgi:DeoR family transcriptional regulator, fructose operon transcriptional repressor